MALSDISSVMNLICVFVSLFHKLKGLRTLHDYVSYYIKTIPIQNFTFQIFKFSRKSSVVLHCISKELLVTMCSLYVAGKCLLTEDMCVKVTIRKGLM